MTESNTLSPIRIESLNNLEDSQLKHYFDDAHVSALIGSGVSIWEPTNLPSGQQLSSEVFEIIFGNSKKIWDPFVTARIKEHYKNVPFEKIMERCPEEKILRQGLRQFFSDRPPNALHHLLAKTLLEGNIESIVTTNYDCCIDTSLLSLANCENWESMKVVTRITEETSLHDTTGSIYLKIHGTVDDVDGESLIFTLRQENALPGWKRELLRSLWRDRILFIVGYSGTDFEICPEIKALRPKRVVWNFPDECRITSYARRVVRETNGLILLGDICDLLTRVYGPLSHIHGPLDKNSLASKSIASDFRKYFSETQLRLWQARILTSMTCPGPALSICDQLLSESTHEASLKLAVREERAKALYNLGLHRQSAQLFEAVATSQLLETNSSSSMCDLHLQSCDSWRSFGSFRRARKRLALANAAAQHSTSQELVAAVRMKELAGLRQRYNLSKRLGFARRSQAAQDQARTLLQALASEFAQAGAWQKFYETGRWAKLFDLSADSVKPPDLYEAPPPRDAYTRLGDIMGQAIALRDELKRHLTLSDEELGRVNEFASLSEEFGVLPEAWKLRFLIARKSFRAGPWKNCWTVLYNLKQMLISFWRCEYSILMRVGYPLLEVLTSRSEPRPANNANNASQKLNKVTRE